MFHHQKGTQVNHTTSSAKSPAAKTGLFAVLSDLPRDGGSGAGSLGGGRTSSLRLLGLFALAFAAFLGLTASSALAAQTHVFKGSFGTPGSGPGQLSEPSALAVNEASHDVYVVDQGNNHAHRLDLTGAPA